MQFLQALCQLRVIPARALVQPVVGDHVGFELRLAEVLQPDHRDGLEPQELCSLEPAVSGDDARCGIDQDRGIEAERSNAPGDRPDLRPFMDARIGWIGHERRHRELEYLRSGCRRRLLARAACAG